MNKRACLSIFGSMDRLLFRLPSILARGPAAPPTLQRGPLLPVYWFQSKNNALTQPSSRSTMDVTYTWQNCGPSARPNAVFHPPR